MGKQKKISVNQKIKGQIVKKIVTKKIVPNIKEELEKKLSEYKEHSNVKQISILLKIKV